MNWFFSSLLSKLQFIAKYYIRSRKKSLPIILSLSYTNRLIISLDDGEMPLAGSWHSERTVQNPKLIAAPRTRSDPV
jgi:hypothetical protein